MSKNEYYDFSSTELYICKDNFCILAALKFMNLSCQSRECSGYLG